MSLFTKALASLTFQDLSEFLAGKEPEGLRVEYKAGFPKHEDLARAVAAMANAEGGIIILGVPTDARNRPKAPTGIPSEGNIADRIANICAAKVRPALAPEVRTYDLPESREKCLVLLRVPASQLAPHYLPDYFGDPLIPIRIDGKISHADVPTVEFLLQRRRGDVAATKRELGRKDPPSAKQAFEKKTRRVLSDEEGFSVRIAVYPTMGPEKLSTLTHDFDRQLRDSLPYRCPFDVSDIDWGPARPMMITRSGFEIRSTQSDVRFTCAGSDGRGIPVSMVVRVTETGVIQFGSIFLRNEFRLEGLVRQLRDTLGFAKGFFERVSYFGELELELSLENVNPGDAANLLTADGRSWKYESQQHVQVREVFDFHDLGEGSSEILKNVIRRVLREGNVPVAEDYLDSISRVPG